MDVDVNRLRTSPHMVGDTVTLQAEEEEETAIEKLGEASREYVVTKCVHVLTHAAEHSPRLSVYVSVTDPNS
jgi:S-adenosylmethionine hydrolase